jgi:short-subunit dehydrogenase
MNCETVLVTGASSGIGRELAKCFAAEGCRMVLLARNTQALQSLAAELRPHCAVEPLVLSADLAEAGTPARVFAELQAAGVVVDVLVNNAGFGAHGPFADLPLDRQLEMVRVNVTALTHFTGLFLPGMIQRRRGGVLNVASTAAFQPGPGMAVYYATKSFVLSFSEALSEELAGTGVTVTTLCPGPTAHTNFGAAAGFKGPDILTRGALTAVAVARCGHDGFRRGRCVIVPGLKNRALAFAVRLLPRIVVRKFLKAVMSLRTEKRAENET